MTAEQLMTQLAQDPEWVRRQAEDAERIALEEAALAEAEKPIRDDLAAVGLDVSSVYDLVESDGLDYPEAVPILMRHLRAGNYPDNILEGLARALAVPSAGAYWPIFRDLYRSESRYAVSQGLASALAGSATSDHVDELIELVEETRDREATPLMLPAIWGLGRQRGIEFLRSVVDDPRLGHEARRLVKRRPPK